MNRPSAFETSIELMTRLAHGDYSARGTVSDVDDEHEAIIAGLNMLGEELSAQAKRRALAESRLDDATLMYERAPVMFASVNPDDLTITKCNHTLSEGLGYSKDELVERPLAQLYPERRRASSIAWLRDAIERSEYQEAEQELLCRDGGSKSAQIRVSVVPAAGKDEPAKVLLAWLDLTQRKQLELELLQAQKMEAMGRLAGGVAHDFNNILTAILGLAAFLRDQVSDRPHAAQDVEQLIRATRRATELTRQLLTFSRKEVVQPEVTDVNDLVVGIHKMIRRILGENIELASILADGVWLVEIDPTQLEQVLINLVVNAKDALQDGGRLLIETENVFRSLRSSPKEAVLIRVSDNGTGMSPEICARAFDPFFTTKPAGLGTGLGLTTSRAIIERFEGELTVQSTEGLGSTFEIVIPRSRAPRSQPPPASSLPPTGDESVLIVEDDASVRHIASRILQTAGYRVRTAANGVEALGAASSLPRVDLLLTDMVMPHMGGLQLAATLRQRWPDLRVLLCSGYLGEIDPESLADADFIPKPFQSRDLLEKVRRALDKPASNPVQPPPARWDDVPEPEDEDDVGNG